MSIIKHFCICVLLFAFFINSYGQDAIGSVSHTRTCHTMHADSILRKRHPGSGSISDFEKRFALNITKFKKSRAGLRLTTEDTLIIPVVVHVIHNGDAVGTNENISAAQVYSQIKVLNEDYQKRINTPGYNTNAAGAGLALKFVVALYDPFGNDLPEQGIHRYDGGRDTWDSIDSIDILLKPATIFDPGKYFNIWTINFGGEEATTLGYAQFPDFSGLPGLDEISGLANSDGVVIRYNAFGNVGNLKSPYNKGRTATHEIGHFFGLRHICGDQFDCSGTDYCADTPPTGDYIYNCPTTKLACDGQKAMVQNYMDYTSDACMNIFTNDQKTRMMTVLNTSLRRKELLKSLVYLATSLPSANFTVSGQTICMGSTVTLSGFDTRNASSWKWEIFNNAGAVYTAYTQKIIYKPTVSGVFAVRYIVGNSFGYDTLVKSNALSVLSDSIIQFPYIHDFESANEIKKWVVYNPSQDSSWNTHYSASAFGNGTKSIYFNNFDKTHDKTGIRSGMITPRLNFFAASNRDAYLTFDVAYARASATLSDTLAIYYSIDCGKTFKTLWKKGGNNLSTAPDTNIFFTPASTQWRSEQISLTPLNGASNVYLMFMNISGWGNNIFLDNIDFLVPQRTSTPTADFTALPTVVCPGSFVFFSDQSTQFPTSWFWSVPEISGKTSNVETSAGQNFGLRFYVPGIYNVTLKATNTFGTGSITKSSYIYVATLPGIELTSNPSNTSIQCNQSITLKATGGIDYTWYSNFSIKPIFTDSTSITLKPQQTITYTVYGSNSYGCKNWDYLRITVSGSCDSTTAVTHATLNNDIKIYPNQVNDYLMVDLNFNTFNNSFLKIINPEGKEMITKTNISSRSEIDVRNIPNGIYFVKIITGDRVFIRRFIK